MTGRIHWPIHSPNAKRPIPSLDHGSVVRSCRPPQESVGLLPELWPPSPATIPASSRNRLERPLASEDTTRGEKHPCGECHWATLGPSKETPSSSQPPWQSRSDRLHLLVP